MITGDQRLGKRKGNRFLLIGIIHHVLLMFFVVAAAECHWPTRELESRHFVMNQPLDY